MAPIPTFWQKVNLVVLLCHLNFGDDVLVSLLAPYSRAQYFYSGKFLTFCDLTSWMQLASLYIQHCLILYRALLIRALKN